MGVDEGWQALAEEQAGVVARRQLMDHGLSSTQAWQGINGRRWRTLFPGVYATFTGPLPDLARIWAAILYAGPQACASHLTAIWLATRTSEDAGNRHPAPGWGPRLGPGRGARLGPGHGTRPGSGAEPGPGRSARYSGLDSQAIQQAPSLIDLSVPAERRVTRQPGIRIHLCRDYPARLHPSASPPRTRVEDAVLDAAEAELDPERALSVVLRATQRRLSTASRLRKALARRTRHRWRALLEQVLAEVEDGVASPLERRYAKDVERAHGLPRGERNRAEARPGGGHLYRDVRYRAWSTIVELDGLEAHPGDERFRDLRRDNHAAVQGETVLRYGWRDVVARACEAAAQVAMVLRTNGWPSSPAPCGPDCRLPPSTLGSA